MLNKAKYKTRLTQNNEAKHISNAKKKKKKKGERERRSDRSTWSPFPFTPWKNLSFE